MSKQKKIEEIRKSGYAGSIPDCRCGWIGTLHEVSHNEKGVATCPECEKELVQSFKLETA